MSAAARSVASAANGQIVVDAETYADIGRAYPDARQERLTLKGKQEPVDAYWIPS
jgi:class 3 adenylate cyclase